MRLREKVAAVREAAVDAKESRNGAKKKAKKKGGGGAVWPGPRLDALLGIHGDGDAAAAVPKSPKGKSSRTRGGSASPCPEWHQLFL
eukprot:39236-Prymnesium_polylepis.1